MRLPDPNAASAPASDESEALQADVMRFMAILGLCLMAIFALVQSLPSGLPDPKQGTAQAPRATPDLGPVVAARAEQARLAQVIETQRRQLDRNAVAIAAQAETLAEVTQGIAAHRERRDALVGQIAELEAEYEALDRRRVTAERAYAASVRERSSLQQQIGVLTRELADRQSPQPQSDRQVSARPAPGPEGEAPRPGDVASRAPGRPGRSTPEDRREQVVLPADEMVTQRHVDVRPTANAAEQQQGFSLRFASEEALVALVGQDEIRVFVRSDARAWRLEAASLAFVEAALPRRLHIMNEATVSSRLQTAARRVAGATTPDWGVSLSPRLQRAIQAAIQGREAGNLVIHDDGRIVLQ